MEKSAPSPAEEAGGIEEKKKLYVFLTHHPGSPLVHTLYALEIPNPRDPCHPAPVPEVEERKRLPLVPNLSLPGSVYGRDMCFANLGSKLYFIGGTPRRGTHHFKEIYILDTAGAYFPLPGTPPERSSEFLIPGPPMNTAKIEPVAFADDGKIFVLSGERRMRFTPGRLSPFEMFTPGPAGGGKWEILPDPPFQVNVRAHVVVNGKLIVYPDIYSRSKDQVIHIFDMETRVWTKKIELSLRISSGTLLLKKQSKMYTCLNPFYGSVDSYSLDLSPTFTGKNDFVPLTLCRKELAVVKSAFPSPLPSTYMSHVGNGRFCFTRVGCAPYYPDEADDMIWCHPDKCFMNVALFDSSTDKLLNCAGFTLNAFGGGTIVVAAIAV